MVYYKTIETNLWNIQGWIVSADTKEDAHGFALKRSDDVKIEDVKSHGRTTVILGTSDNYEDVMNFRDKLNKL